MSNNLLSVAFASGDFWRPLDRGRDVAESHNIAGKSRRRSVNPVGDDLDMWEHRLESDIGENSSIRETEREALIKSRWGRLVQAARNGHRNTVPNHGWATFH
jgi:hypothetical protein